MSEKAVNLISAGLSAIGTIFILSVAFEIDPEGLEKFFLFAGVICFVLAGFMRKLK